MEYGRYSTFCTPVLLRKPNNRQKIRLGLPRMLNFILFLLEIKKFDPLQKVNANITHKVKYIFPTIKRNNISNGPDMRMKQ